MKIAMFTNTYLPHVGGVAESVARFAAQLRLGGHEVLVVAPWVDGEHEDRPGVLRVPAWEHVYETDFSIPMPIPGYVDHRLEGFSPDIVHAHHPFLLGDTAMRIAAMLGVPIVFTNHTQYDVYTHYLPFEAGLAKQFVTRLATGYANLCDAVIAPSRSIQRQLESSGVESPIEVIPTGVDLSSYGRGDRDRFRQRFGVPTNAFVVGHVGRLAPEKNLAFLAGAAADFVSRDSDAWMILVGKGPCEHEFVEAFMRKGCSGRLVRLGVLLASELADAYAAMDAFAFASHTETQGMVLVEAMAAGTPVVAVDAAGARDLVIDGHNGLLLPKQDASLFTQALRRLARMHASERGVMRRHARATATHYAMPRCAALLLDLYQRMVDSVAHPIQERDKLHATIRAVAQEGRILGNLIDAGTHAVLSGEGK